MRSQVNIFCAVFAISLSAGANGSSPTPPTDNGCVTAMADHSAATQANILTDDQQDIYSTLTGFTEKITDIYTGSQMYSVVMPGVLDSASTDKQSPPGLYKRTQKGWKLILPGKILVDHRGAPVLSQLGLSKSDDRNYLLIVVDGYLHLVTSYTEASQPDSFIKFGTKESPLYEVGSGQKRFLPPIHDSANIAIFHDSRLTVKGSQLVLVSFLFDQTQSVGEGLTFAVEILPNKNTSVVQLNARPTVIDYEFHKTRMLEYLVGQKSNNDRLLYSKILVEQYTNADFSVFRNHVDFVKQKVEEFANYFLSPKIPSQLLQVQGAKVSYNSTANIVEREVDFSKSFAHSSNISIDQYYFPAREQGVLRIAAYGRTFELPGFVNFSPAKKMSSEGEIDQEIKPAIWEGHDSTVLIVDDVVYAILPPQMTGLPSAELVKIDEFTRIFGSAEPNDLQLATALGPDEDSRTVILFISFETAAAGKTIALKFTNMYRSVLRYDQSVQLLNFGLQHQELTERISYPDNKNDILFDRLTPNTKSSAAYQQSYDQSMPHVSLLDSTSIKMAYKFKKPNTTIPFNSLVSYAVFSEVHGVQNPSGLYFNSKADEISGNESDRSLGQLLINPHKNVVDKKKPLVTDYMFAQLEIAKPRNMIMGMVHDDDEYEEVTDLSISLNALDASFNNGSAGYKFELSFVAGKASHVPLAFSREMQTDIRFFQDAFFIRGQKSNKKMVYLVVAFSNSDVENSKAATYVVPISLKELNVVGTHLITDQEALTQDKFNERLGFDEEGVPNLKLDPSLSLDSLQFSVFEFNSGKRAFPNQGYSGKKKTINFSGWQNQDIGTTYIKYDDSWEVHGPHAVQKLYPDLGKSSDLGEFDNFKELAKKLDNMASNKAPPKRLILVVPTSLRELIWDFIVSKSIAGNHADTPIDKIAPFNWLNSDLKLNYFNKGKSVQEQFLANLDSWRRIKEARPKERSFLLARLDEMNAMNRSNGAPEPRDKAQALVIRDVRAGAGSDLTQVATKEEFKYPHALYLLGAGQPLSLNDFKAQKPQPSASMLILATADEMKAVALTAQTEIEYGMLDQFEIQEIQDPDQNSMAQSLSSIFKNADVQSLQYKFSATEIKPRAQLDSDESFHVVMDYAISRFVHLLEQKREPKFESFMRFRGAFATAILSDKEARKTRVINKYFIERVLTQVFDIPMNLASLPSDDPIKILSSPEALLRMQEAGYSGPFDLKAKVRDTMVSQTRADAGKPIPSSIIVFGNTGAGKTYLFMTLIKMLNLKLYNFSAPADDAGAVIVNVGQLTDSKESSGNASSNMDVDYAIQHLENFLSKPNGYRGYILIDDVHAAKDTVKAKMLSWLRGLFEAPNGMYTASSQTSGVRIRRPIRNLNIFMTLNPTADQDQISKYAHDKSKPTSEEILLATLATNEFKIEPSFLRRWGRIINLDYMPAGAKGPELIKSVARASNNLLNTNNRIALVDPSVIQTLVENNAKADARTFLSASTSSLIEVASNDQRTGTLVMVVPSMAQRRPPMGGEGTSDVESSSEQISKWVEKNTRTLSLDASLEGSLVFLKLIVDAFRIPLYESLIMALQEDRRFAGDSATQKTLLGPMLAAVHDHLHDKGYVNVPDLELNASEFGLRTAVEREQFKSTIERMPKVHKLGLFPSFFKAVDAQITTWQYIDHNNANSVQGANSYKAIFAELIQSNRQILRERLSQILQVKDVDLLPDPSLWITQLSGESNIESRRAGTALAHLLWDYLPKIMSNDLALRSSETAAQLNIYNITRLFLYALDRSIVQLPWVPTARFLLSSLDMITQDQVLSQKAGVQKFLFTEPHRLINATLTDFSFQVIANSQAFENISVPARKKLREEFTQTIENVLKSMEQP